MNKLNRVYTLLYTVHLHLSRVHQHTNTQKCFAPNRLHRLLFHFSPPKFIKEFQTIVEYLENPENLPIEVYYSLGFTILRGLLKIPIDSQLSPNEQKVKKLEVVERCLLLLFKSVGVSQSNGGFEMICSNWEKEISFEEIHDILKKKIPLSEYC